MSIVDAIGTTMDRLAERVGDAIFHERGRPIPALRFGAGRGSALAWAGGQDPETLNSLTGFIKRQAGAEEMNRGDLHPQDLDLIADRLRQLGAPEQAEYFTDIDGARGWFDGFFLCIEAARARRMGL